MKFTTIIFLLMCMQALGVYDSSAVSINCGGYGFAASSGATSNGESTMSNPACRFGVDGTLVQVRLRLYSWGVDCTSAKLKIVSGSAGEFVLEREIDITSQVNAGLASPATGIYTVTISNPTINGNPVAVESDEFIAFYTSGGRSIVRRDSGSDIFQWYVVDADTVSMTTDTSSDLLMDCTVSTSEFIEYDDTTDLGDGSVVSLATPNAGKYWIVFEDVNVPDDNSLTIELQCTDTATAANVTQVTMTIDMSADTVDDGTNFDSLTGQDGHKIDYFIWINAASGAYQVFYCNYEVGQGQVGGAADIRMISLADDRMWETITAANKIRRIRLTNEDGEAVVSRVVVCRKPVVCLGDSIAYNIREELATAFTYERYVIDASIGGNYLTLNNGLVTPIIWRWNSLGSDLCAMKDVIFVPVNGICTKDMSLFVNSASLSDAYLDTVAAMVAGQAAKLIADSQLSLIYNSDGSSISRGAEDIVVCGMIPRIDTNPQEYINENYTQRQINRLLQYTAHKLRLPYADVWSYPEGYDEVSILDQVHPDADGEAWIAGRIASAYENNLIPGNPIGGGPIPTEECPGPPLMDSNGDCKIDIIDFAELSLEWMSCGLLNQSNCWE